MLASAAGEGMPPKAGVSTDGLTHAWGDNTFALTYLGGGASGSVLFSSGRMTRSSLRWAFSSRFRCRFNSFCRFS
jgi:hypothetical protein